MTELLPRHYISRVNQSVQVNDTIQVPNDISMGALTSIIFRTRLIILNHRLKSSDLGTGQFPLMMYLSRNQNITQETLARHFNIDRGAIARSVKKLEDSGYITRIIDPDSRRAVRLFLSEKGEAMIPDLIRINHEWEEIVTSSLSEDEKIQFFNLLRKVAISGLACIRESGETDYASFCGSGGDRS